MTAYKRLNKVWFFVLSILRSDYMKTTANVLGNASNDRDIATLFKDSEDKGSFYGFPVRRGDTSDSNFDSDGFKSGEEDGGNRGPNDDTDAEEAR